MTTTRPAFRHLILIVVAALIGLNLRPFITSIGPLAGSIHSHTALGLQGMALLTLVPMLLMGILAFTGPALESAIGARRAVVLALLVICGGCALRMLAWSGWALVATAAVIGLGVAIVQAVFPGIVKREFSGHVGPMMGLYSATLMGGGALGALISPTVAGATGSWETGLACFALPALIATLLAAAFLPADTRTQRGHHTARTFLARPRTWLLMACFGLVNGGYSSVVAWLAPAYQERGWSATASAGLLATLAVSQAITALTLPILARKRPDRRAWLWLTLAMQATGFIGLAVAPGLSPHVLATILGAGLGGCFALSLIVALDHLPDPAQAGALAALMQGGGFIIAAVPAWLVAALHDLTGGYAAGWTWHLVSVTVVAALTIRLSPTGYAKAMPPLDTGHRHRPPGSSRSNAIRIPSLPGLGSTPNAPTCE
ncbi:putative transporter YycB [Castellaniella defragrans]